MGKDEDRSTKANTYNIENELDAYILAKVKNRKLILDARNYNKVVENTKKEIAVSVIKEVKKALCNH